MRTLTIALLAALAASPALAEMGDGRVPDDHPDGPPARYLCKWNSGKNWELSGSEGYVTLVAPKPRHEVAWVGDRPHDNVVEFREVDGARSIWINWSQGFIEGGHAWLKRDGKDLDEGTCGWEVEF